jgi:ABC-type uncharacterized transport system ATPase subunit
MIKKFTITFKNNFVKDTAQTTCMRLMGKKIAVSQSTSGDIPDNGLDSLIGANGRA